MRRIAALVAIGLGYLVAVAAIGARAPGQVSGQVVDQNGSSLAGVQVSFAPGGQSATTDRQGTFAVSGLEDGDYTVTVQARGLPAQRFKVSVEGGQLKPPRLRVELPPAEQKVTGKVVDRDGKGIASSLVTFSGPKKDSVPTNPRGAFVFEGPAGQYRVTVEAAGRSFTFDNVVIDDNNQMRPATLVIDPGDES
jgi:inhibitor of cysteine peptidase